MVFLLLTQSFPAKRGGGWVALFLGNSGPPHRGAYNKMMTPGPLPLSALGSRRLRVPIILLSWGTQGVLR